MDNPARTALHFAEVRQRREVLQERFATLFAERKDCVLEIGCGNGHFLAAYAQAHPETVCVGIDIEESRIERAERKRRRAQLSRLHFLHAEAGDFLAALPEPVRFSAIYLLFPDPWPKKRHHKHRLVQPDFLAELASRAVPGARLYFRTDHDAYFAAARAVLAASPQWHVVDERWPFEFPSMFQERAAQYSSLIAVRR